MDFEILGLEVLQVKGWDLFVQVALLKVNKNWF